MDSVTLNEISHMRQEIRRMNRINLLRLEWDMLEYDQKSKRITNKAVIEDCYVEIEEEVMNIRKEMEG